MPVTIDGTTGVSAVQSGAVDLTTDVTGVLPNANGGTGTATFNTSFKNRIINGAMMIDQRNAGASVTPATTGYYSCDRYAPQMTQASKFSVQQQTSIVPNGFAYAQKYTQVSTPTVGAGDYFGTEQTIEGFNIADLKWGTANAQTITVSFWVYSSLTGTYCGSIFSVTANRSYIFTYSISSANTWTYVTATIPGDTSGTYNINNTEGFRLRFTLTTGSNFQSTAGSWLAGNYATVSGHASWITSSGATFYITGVQLEKGSTATSFDYRPYGTELQLCQRYYQVLKGQIGVAANTTSINWCATLLSQMRTSPSLAKYGGSNYVFGDMVSVAYGSTGTPTLGYGYNELSLSGLLTGFTGLTAYRSYRHEPAASGNDATLFAVSAEL